MNLINISFTTFQEAMRECFVLYYGVDLTNSSPKYYKTELLVRTKLLTSRCSRCMSFYGLLMSHDQVNSPPYYHKLTYFWKALEVLFDVLQTLHLVSVIGGLRALLLAGRGMYQVDYY